LQQRPFLHHNHMRIVIEWYEACTYLPKERPELLEQLKEVDSPVIHRIAGLYLCQSLLGKWKEPILQLLRYIYLSPWHMILLANVESCQRRDSLEIHLSHQY